MLHYIRIKSTYKKMQILIIPFGLILWYLAYESKPINNDEVTCLWEEKNYVKRTKLLGILEESF